MDTLIVPNCPTKNLSGTTESSLLTVEEQQLAIDEQLMLDREAYAHGSEY